MKISANYLSTEHFSLNIFILLFAYKAWSKIQANLHR